jgi:transcription elongation factor Elf1
MEEDQNQDLVHVHICRSCGHRQHREDVDNRAVASGIIECPICGMSGPLDVQIVNSDQAGPEVQRKGPHRA